MPNFNSTPEQERVFKSLIRVFKKAKKQGLVFYAKSDSLVAYTKDADDYIEEDFEGSLGTRFSPVPYLSSSNCISDSGADDYGNFRSLEDQEKYS